MKLQSILLILFFVLSFEQVQAQIIPEETSFQDPVSVAAGVVQRTSGKQEIVIKIKIHPGYHTYAYVAEQDPYIATKIDIELPEGYEKVGNLKKPSYEYYNENGTTVYTGALTFSQEIKGKGTGEVTCYLTWQACEEDFCLMPVNRRPYKLKL